MPGVLDSRVSSVARTVPSATASTSAVIDVALVPSPIANVELPFIVHALPVDSEPLRVYDPTVDRRFGLAMGDTQFTTAVESHPTLAGDRRSDDHGRPSRNVLRRDGVVGRGGLAGGRVGGAQHVDMMLQSCGCVGKVVEGQFDVKDASATGLNPRVLYGAPRSSEGSKSIN